MSRIVEAYDLDHYPNALGYKKAGTSEMAAHGMRDRAGVLKDLVLARLRQFPGGLTADELAEHLGASILSVRPRCSELIAAGKIKASGNRRKNHSGKSADVLIISDRSIDPPGSPPLQWVQDERPF